MKHLIIFNRASGNREEKENIAKELLEKFKGLDYEIYETKGNRDVEKYLKEYFQKETKETVRVYAVGGDGTIHECANGIVGFTNAELAIIAAGTGNDFVKYYGDKSRFNIESAINGKAQPIDLSEISGPSLDHPWYSINVINFGFDAVVGAVGNKYKEMGKDDPYGKALKVAMLKARFNKISVKADGKKVNKKFMLLASLAQGNYVGGKFKTAPKSKNNDGLIDITLIRCICFAHLGMIMGPYTAGKHLDNVKFPFVYRQAKHIEIDAKKDIDICVDGEMIRGSHFDVIIVPEAIKLVIPE